MVTVYENDGTTKKVFVSSGTITVNEDSSVQVLAEEAQSVEDLDLSAARELLSQSQSALAQAQTDVVSIFFLTKEFVKLYSKNQFLFNFLGPC